MRSQSLPQARYDINAGHSGYVIRVSLKKAVHSITQVTDLLANEHVPEIMREVDEKGSKNVLETKFVLQTNKQWERGGPSYEREFDFWSPMWN